MASKASVTRQEDLEAADKQHVWHPFTQQQDWEAEPQLVIDRADGVYLIDVDGNRYMDGVSSLWANIHGHNHPRINAAISAQLGKVAHTTFLGLSHPGAVELAERLVSVAPGGLSRVFYSDTGAAAVEIALKIAYQYWQQLATPRPEKRLFLSLRNGYHGDTIGAMSVGGIELYDAKYRGLMFPALKAASIDEAIAIIESRSDELAAVIVEPMIQGAGGMLTFAPGDTRRLWEAARRHDVLFIADEVATGFGRTGRLFACEHEGVEPDLMALGKGISGGYLPLAATMATESIYEAFLGAPEDAKTFFHGHTFTANPLACAAGIASFDLFEEEQTLARLQPRIDQLREGLEALRELDIVGDVRQCGFMAGVELVRDKQTRAPFDVAQRAGVRVIREARKHGAILRPLSDIIVIMPPLSISEAELAALLDAVRVSISTVAGELA